MLARLLFGLLVLIAVPPDADAQNSASANYQVLAPSVSQGGVFATSANFSILGVVSAIGQGLSSSATLFGVSPGFVAYPFVSTPVVSATGVVSAVDLSWTAALGVLGYSVGSYSIGQSNASGGPYSFASEGNVLSATISGLTAGTPYYFIVRAQDAFNDVIATSTEVSATPSSPPPLPPPPPSGGSPGGGAPGGGSPPITAGAATANFSGRAYPRSTITLLKDAQVAASTIADANAMFSISLGNLSAGNFIFSVYSEDSAGNRSSLLSFPVSLTAGATTNITGIFISPTIDADKSQVKKGDNLAIFGQSSPKSTITITVNSETELFLQAKTDAIGAYLYNLDTSPLEFGAHAAKSKAAVASEISDFGQTIGFLVGNSSIAKAAKAQCGIGDLNCDGHVNLIDFSIMAFWYNRPLSGAGFKADLKKDGKADLTDFSILASHWTG